MTPFRFVILSVLLTTFMGASNGMASQHHHESHDLGISSPFEKEQKKGELHCFLNNHQHGDKFCPHSKKLENGEKHYLSAYCGGKSTGTFPSFSFQSHFVTIVLSSQPYQGIPKKSRGNGILDKQDQSIFRWLAK